MSQSYEFGYANSGIVPLRSEPVDASEMCTQVLLGETFEILEVTERWFRILTDLDNYNGWVNRSESATLTRGEYERWTKHSERIPSWNYTYRVFSNEKEALLVPPGARLIFEDDDKTVKLPEKTYQAPEIPARMSSSSPMGTALDFLGTPYLWGGRTDVGVDCSGLIQTVYLLYGKKIPADSWKQEEFFSNPVSSLKKAERGDIIFFNPGKERVSHVGFYLGQGLLLHASGKVKINAISNELTANDMNIEYSDRLANSMHSIYRSEIE